MANVKFTPVPGSPEQQAMLEEDLAGAQKYGPVWLGGQYVFWRVLLRLRYAPLAEVERAYLRIEHVTMSTCCRRTTLPLPMLVLAIKAGERKKISFEEEEPVRELLAALPLRQPQIAIGYDKPI